MNRIGALCVLLMLSGCASSMESVQSDFGPAHMEKKAGGYNLRNRRITATIDEQTGQLSFASIVTSLPFTKSNCLFSTGEDSTPVGGYVESRDAETWQYIGQSKDGKFGWRIVYCLYYDQLNVTYIVQNKSREPITGHIILQHVSPVPVQVFNEDQSVNPRQSDGSLRSDERTLQPDERINMATRWTLAPQ